MENYIQITNPTNKDITAQIKRIYELMKGKSDFEITISKQTIKDCYIGANRTYITIVEDKAKKGKNAAKHKYGTYKNVLLTEEEYNKLLQMDNGSKAIEYLSEYREYKGYKAKSDYLAIRKWVFTAIQEDEQKKARLSQNSKPNRFTQNDRPMEEYKSSLISDDELENIEV